MPASSWIVDADAASFAAVVERSRSVPVVLDFWATWCGPCKTLGPLLETLVNEDPGRFLLAKVDIDRSPELAQAFRITSVPTVIAVVDGRPVDGFQGALPEADLRAFLDRFAPSLAGVDPLEEARALEQAGRLDEAIDLLREALDQGTVGAEGRVQLARLHVERGERTAAEHLLGELSPEEAALPAARALRARLAFLEGAGDLDALRADVASEPGSAAARLRLGQALVALESHAEGLEQLLEAIRLDPGGEGVPARKAMLEVFDVLGLEDPLANEYRFKLSLELFA